jgi:hypothetical protein
LDQPYRFFLTPRALRKTIFFNLLMKDSRTKGKMKEMSGPNAVISRRNFIQVRTLNISRRRKRRKWSTTPGFNNPSHEASPSLALMAQLAEGMVKSRIFADGNRLRSRFKAGIAQIKSPSLELRSTKILVTLE